MKKSKIALLAAGGAVLLLLLGGKKAIAAPAGSTPDFGRGFVDGKTAARLSRTADLNFISPTDIADKEGVTQDYVAGYQAGWKDGGGE